MKMGYTSMRDGKDAPVTGNPGYDTVAITQTSPTRGPSCTRVAASPP